MVHPARLKDLNTEPRAPGLYVLYWMQQSQRSAWNHALEHAIRKANELGLPVLAYFGLTARFPEANERHYGFMLEGLKETSRALARRGIMLVVLREKDPTGRTRPGGASAAPDRPRPSSGILPFGPEAGAVALAGRAALAVVDRGYLRIQRVWRERAAAAMGCPLVQVESDVVVPVETVSPKEEYAASTIRPRIARLLPEFLVPLVETEPRKTSLGVDVAGLLKGKEARDSLSKLALAAGPPRRGGSRRAPPSLDLVDLEGRSVEEILAELGVDRRVKRVDWIRGGAPAAEKLLREFIGDRLDFFADRRNDPSLDCLSNLSPYLHFGQVSPLEAALAARGAGSPGTDSFLEELVVRRELGMNFAFYNPRYDSYGCLPEWARKTLESHEVDRRERLYGLGELERAETHDPYWNAAQREMTVRGKMHGYMRMYWGKKILEWSPTPREAHARALALNNRYSIDGRDPNGFAGVAWCFGKHDRPWAERPVFGSVRYMNARGLERKFDIAAYVEKIRRLGGIT